MITSIFKSTLKDSEIAISNPLVDGFKDTSKFLSQIQDTIIHISTNYLGSSIEEIDSAISHSLKMIGRTLWVDRVQVHDYDYERKECVTLFEWCESGISSTIEGKDNVPLDLIMDMVTVHNRGDYIQIADVNLLPDGLPKRVMKHQQIKSVVTVPTMLDGKCIGFISFDSVRKLRCFSIKEIALLKLFSNITVSFLSRSKGEKRISKLLERTSIQNKRLRDFSFIASHNIRSAVANLSGISSLLVSEPNNLDYLNMLQASISKLNSSLIGVNDLLDLEKKIEIHEFKTCNITTFIKKSLKSYGSSIKTLEVEVTNNLTRKLMIKAIPIYLENVFNQIISNALKYGVSKNARKIIIDYAKGERTIDIRIKDFGNGINFKKYGHKLFQVGSRFHPESCNNLGMGLFITKYQIEAMGGHIDINSEENKGFSVIMSFPIKS